MHYYQFNIGDYMSHTAGLSPMEDLAYRRLLDAYYLSERPFNVCSTDVAREIGLREYQKEVEYVLGKYFTKTDLGWVNARCEKNIQFYNNKLKSAKRAGKASGKARQIKASEQTLNDRSTDVELTNNHKPITNNQEAGRSPAAPIPFVQIIDLYHKHLPTLPHVLKLTEKRRGQLRQRHTEDVHSLARWESFFAAVSRSDFLMGRKPAGNGRDTPFRADLEWLTNSTNFTRFAEGKYHD